MWHRYLENYENMTYLKREFWVRIYGTQIVCPVSHTNASVVCWFFGKMGFSGLQRPFFTFSSISDKCNIAYTVYGQQYWKTWKIVTRRYILYQIVYKKHFHLKYVLMLEPGIRIPRTGILSRIILPKYSTFEEVFLNLAKNGK